MKLDETDKAVIIWVCIAIFLLLFFMFRNNKDKGVVSYWAVFKNGETVKVDNIIAVPILSHKQISTMWPEYYAETKIDVGGNEIILQSKPFLFCDDPTMEGCYAGRNVYCPSVKRP